MGHAILKVALKQLFSKENTADLSVVFFTLMLSSVYVWVPLFWNLSALKYWWDTLSIEVLCMTLLGGAGTKEAPKALLATSFGNVAQGPVIVPSNTFTAIFSFRRHQLGASLRPLLAVSALRTKPRSLWGSVVVAGRQGWLNLGSRGGAWGSTGRMSHLILRRHLSSKYQWEWNRLEK